MGLPAPEAAPARWGRGGPGPARRVPSSGPRARCGLRGPGYRRRCPSPDPHRLRRSLGTMDRTGVAPRLREEFLGTSSAIEPPVRGRSLLGSEGSRLAGPLPGTHERPVGHRPPRARAHGSSFGSRRALALPSLPRRLEAFASSAGPHRESRGPRGTGHRRAASAPAPHRPWSGSPNGAAVLAGLAVTRAHVRRRGWEGFTRGSPVCGRRGPAVGSWERGPFPSERKAPPSMA
jgi:hypothetical protein